MAIEKNLGTVAPVPKGEWSSAEIYDPLNIVTFSASSFIAKKKNSNIAPMQSTNWEEYWQILAGIERVRVSKTYESVVKMNAGYSTDGVPLYGFVLINTGNVNDADNAKLYMKGEEKYEYLTDLSGAQGIQGEKGETGATGAQGIQGYGIYAGVVQRSFSEANWTTYCAIGHNEEWSSTSNQRNGCRIGDMFIVAGTATDTGNGHIAIFRSTTASGNLIGTCINHAIAYAGKNGTNGADGAKGEKGDKGDKGDNGISVTEITAGTPDSSSGQYTDTPITFKLSDGTSTTLDVRSIRGLQGQQGSQWYVGTAITGTATSTPSTGITLAYANDQYLNYETGYIYTCTYGGVSGVATWKYTGQLFEFYPVGAIYMSTVLISPASKFGGTWTRIQDKFLLSAGSSYTAGNTGGSANAVVVSHTHSGKMTVDVTNYQVWAQTIGTGAGNATALGIANTANGQSGNTITVPTTGESGTGKNLPPYLVVYMWKRVS